MADGKRKLLYDIAIAQTGFIAAMFSGDFNSYSSNPYRLEEVEALKTEQDRELESQKGFEVLGKFLSRLVGNRKF